MEASQVGPLMLSKDVVLAVLYKVYLVSQVISLVNTVQCIWLQGLVNALSHI